MELGSTQSLKKMSNVKISWGVKAGRGTGPTNLPPSRADGLEIWEPQPTETFRAYKGFTFPVPFNLLAPELFF